MRFIHTADLHLGMLPDKDKPWGPARADAVRTSLLRLTEICAREDVDLLLIAGDLFHAPPTERELKDAAAFRGEIHREALARAREICPGVGSVTEAVRTSAEAALVTSGKRPQATIASMAAP